LKLVGASVNSMRDGARIFLIVTHYHRILDAIKPDFVHILSEGRIVKSGGAELALAIEASGYDAVAAD